MKGKIIWVLLIPFFLAACAQTGSVGKDFNRDNVPKIVDGVTTKQKVLNLLGTPISTNVNPDGTELWVYQHIQFTKRWGEYANRNPYTIKDRELNSVQVMFNKSGIVTSCYSVGERAQHGTLQQSRIRCQDYNGSLAPVAATVSKGQILEAQQLLNQNGFNAGKPDGIMGNKTRSAIIQFQKARGLPVDAEISEDLLNELRKTSR